jgi:hypothetical protein
MNNFIDNTNGTPERPKMIDNPFIRGDDWLTFIEEEKQITLGNEQLQVLHDIVDVILYNFKNKDYLNPINLGGAAGCGKSLCTSFLLEWINTKGFPVMLCAPTHKAALVLKKYNSYTASTLHSMLALSPKVDILKLDIRELQFLTSNNKKMFIPYDGIVICDEASMVSSDLYDILLEKCSLMGTIIIFCDDYAQLNPVKEEEQSKVFRCKHQFRLTKIYRQSEKSGLTDILQTLRDTPVYKWDSCQGEEGNLIVEHDLKEFCDKAVSEYKKLISTKDILHTKVLAYTNNRVDNYNKAIHKLLWKDDEFLHKGEILTAYENCNSDGVCITNSMDYIVEDFEPTTIKIPYYKLCKGYRVKLYDAYENEYYEISLLAPEECNETLAVILENVRTDAVKAKKGVERGRRWGMYYSMIESFCTSKELFIDGRCIRKATFKYGYAITTHRSQGSSYDNVFIDMKDISRTRDRDTLRQLQYVSISRTRSDATILV